jgi:hypothetical protein
MVFSRAWALRIVGFLLVIVMADLVATRLRLKYWLPRTNDRSLNVYLYQRDRVRPDVLFVGSSKTLRGIVPSIIEKELGAALGRPVSAFNVAQLGTSAFGNSLVLRDLVDSNGSPGVVVLELSPAALNANHGGIPDSLRYYCSSRDLLRSLGWLSSIQRLTAAAGGSFRGISNLALYLHHSIFPHGMIAGLETLVERRGREFPDPAGPDTSLSELPEESWRKLLQRLRRHHRPRLVDRYRIGGAPEAGFRAIRRLTGDRGIPLVVYNPPVTRAYRRAILPAAVRREFADYITSAAAADGFLYLDLDGGAPRLSQRDFIDLGHLNDDGATKLSRHMARSVLAPLMRDRDTSR